MSRRFCNGSNLARVQHPSLDGLINFTRSSLQQKGLWWFDQRRFQAARVRIASSVGAQIFSSRR
jgi:hypothetical protein